MKTISQVTIHLICFCALLTSSPALASSVQVDLCNQVKQNFARLSEQQQALEQIDTVRRGQEMTSDSLLYLLYAQSGCNGNEEYQREGLDCSVSAVAARTEAIRAMEQRNALFNDLATSIGNLQYEGPIQQASNLYMVYYEVCEGESDI